MRVRERRTGNIMDNMDFLRIFGYTISLAITIIALITLIRLIFLAVKKESPGPLTKSLIRRGSKITKSIRGLLLAAYLKFFIGWFPNDYILEFWRQTWYGLYPYYRLISFCCISLPSFIIACALFLDVVVYNHFYWLPKLAIILIIPLGLKTINWCTEYDCLEFCGLMEAAFDNLDDTPNAAPIFNSEFIKTHPRPYGQLNECLDYSINKYHYYKHLLRVYEAFSKPGGYEKMLFFILTSILQIISWGYILIKALII